VSDRAASAAGTAPRGGLPRHVRFFSRILKALIAAGIPLGFNRLVTIRGRKSGLPRTAALAVLQIGDRRWVWAPWGDVQWVQNLRAAGNATIAERGGKEDVRAIELDPTQRVGFFRDVLAPFARNIPFGYWFIRTVDGVDLHDPEAAAKRCPVFELHEYQPTSPAPWI
jgi:deazaflavin-dependent oxidoreductase (nitroreductase family)